MRLRQLDFSRTNKPLMAGYVLLIVGICSVASATVAGYHLSKQRALLTAAQLTVASTKHTAPSNAEAKPLSTEEARIRGLKVELQHGWSEALAAVEEATRPPLYLLNLSIDAAGRSVRVDGEAPAHRYAVGLVDALQRESRIRSAALSAYQEVSDPNGKPQGTRFTVLATWVDP